MHLFPVIMPSLFLIWNVSLSPISEEFRRVLSSSLHPASICKLLLKEKQCLLPHHSHIFSFFALYYLLSITYLFPYNCKDDLAFPPANFLFQSTCIRNKTAVFSVWYKAKFGKDVGSWDRTASHCSGNLKMTVI